MKEELKSEYDGRLKYYNLFESLQNAFFEAYTQQDYEGMFKSLAADLNLVCMFWPGGLQELAEERDKLRKLYDRIKRYEQYDDIIHEQQARQAVEEYEDYALNLRDRIMVLRTKHHLLFPMSVELKPEETIEYADEFERLTFGSLSAGDKAMPSLEEYHKGYGYVDERTKAVLARQQWLNLHKDADGFFLIVGYNNTGKSTFVHHAHALWRGRDLRREDAASVAFDSQMFVRILNTVMRAEQVADRVAHWDEANLSGRAALSTFNKDILDLYWSNRSQHGLHLWCNPSLEYLEKPLVKERVTGVFLIHRGERGRPPKREFTFIVRSKIMELWDKEKKLDLETLEKKAGSYGLFKGWFYDFPNGEFLREYRRLKDERNEHKNQQLHDKYGDKALSVRGVCQRLGVSFPTVKKHVMELVEKGVFKLEDIQAPSGKFRLREEHVSRIAESMKELHKKQGWNLRKENRKGDA